jgi:hypothetical protein
MVAYTTFIWQIPFDVTAQADNILTPVSSAGSPPTHNRTKLMQQYHPSTTAPNQQQPTPPASSRVYWNPNYPVDPSSSQGSSPMSNYPPDPDDHLLQMRGPSGPDGEDSIPEPPEPFFGSFGVSGPPDEHELHYPMGGYWHMATNQMVDPRHTFDIPSTLHREIAPHPPAPELRHDRHLGGDSLQIRNITPNSSHHYPIPPTKPKISKDRSGSRLKGTGKNRQAGSFVNHQIGRTTTSKGGPSGTAKRETSPEPLRLKDNAPEEDRFLLELRQQHHSSKGKGMWDEICKAYEARFGKRYEKAALQMKLTRAKSKWVIWSENDVSYQPFTSPSLAFPHLYTYLGVSFP